MIKSKIEIPRPAFMGSEPWRLSGLKQISVLFGKNGSGKSLLLRGIREQSPEESHYVMPERIGALTASPGMLQQLRTGTGRMQETSGNYTSNYREQVITRIDAFFAARGFYEERFDKVSKQSIERLINLASPDFNLKFTGSTPPYTLTRTANGQGVSGIQELSSGEAQVFTLALDIVLAAADWALTGAKDPILLIDEPDAHIHPDLQARLSDVIVSVAKEFDIQVIVATHSMSMIAALGGYGGRDTAIVYLDRIQDSHEAVSFDQAKQAVSAALGGVPLIGALFDVPLLLVEGDDDYRIWSQVPRHHQINLSVVPCNGTEIKSVQKLLERTLRTVMDEPDQPIGFALIDGDVGLPQPSPQNPQKYVKFIQLNCHESENLYLTDEVLATFADPWDTASGTVVTESSNYGRHASTLIDAEQWDRQSVDIKSVINSLEQILDPKTVVWSSRVGKAIGTNRPVGQLAHFLGESVVNALWGPEDSIADDIPVE
ncbi:MAG: AAA family ATPase [Chloroflexi bacterium]|nr:AAA family ATPase [Chloroflexota bacterium]